MAFGERDPELSLEWEEFRSRVMLVAENVRVLVEDRGSGSTPHEGAALMQLGILAEALEKAFAE